MASWSGPLICPVCREELPERGNARRRIPWLHGRARLVHPDCARVVDAQGAITEPDGRLLGIKQLTRRRRHA